MKIETKCLHAGYQPKNGEPNALPIYQSTTYRYDSTEHIGKLFDLSVEGHMYSRISNPTVAAVEDKIDLDLIILPGVVFDELGGRIGYGGGYYDKYLSNLDKTIPKAALCYEFQIIDKVPTEKHDIKADCIITEERVITLSHNMD